MRHLSIYTKSNDLNKQETRAIIPNQLNVNQSMSIYI